MFSNPLVIRSHTAIDEIFFDSLQENKDLVAANIRHKVEKSATN
jgi:hypothetical protein